MSDDAAPSSVSMLLLRHGQSEWNAVQRWQGGADSPLTDLGRSQAIETAWVLAGLDVRFGTLWTSDLSRATETAAIIGDALGLGQPIVDPRLREAHAGEWEGLTPAMIEAEWPGWLAEHRRPHSFEPFEAVVERVMAAITDIVVHVAGAAGSFDDPAANALIVAHSGVIRTVIRHLGEHDERVPNLGGVWITATPSAGAWQPSAAASDPRSSTGHVRIELGDLFDPSRFVEAIVVSGIDAPGEDPGEQTDEPDTHRRPER